MPSSAQYTVGTTPVKIAQSGGTPIQIQIHTTASVYFGDATVTPSTGFRLDNGDREIFTLADSDALYAVQSAGSSTVYVMVTIL